MPTQEEISLALKKFQGELNRISPLISLILQEKCVTQGCENKADPDLLHCQECEYPIMIDMSGDTRLTDWHPDAKVFLSGKREPCSIQPCQACIEDGLYPSPVSGG